MTEMEKLVVEFKQEVREKAIDEFAKKLSMHFSDWQMSLAEVGNEREYETIEQAIKGIEEIAEQLKGGEK